MTKKRYIVFKGNHPILIGGIMQKVKWFDDGKNHGFIVYKDNGNVVIRYSTNGNEYVEFELVKTNNGYNMVLINK